MGCLCICIISLCSYYFGYFQHSVFNSVPATRPKWGDICCVIVIVVACSRVLGLRVVFLMASVVTWYVMRIMCFSFCWLQPTICYSCVNMTGFSVFVASDANRLILQCWPRCSVKTFSSSHAAGLGAPYCREYNWRYYKSKTFPSWAVVGN